MFRKKAPRSSIIGTSDSALSSSMRSLQGEELASLATWRFDQPIESDEATLFPPLELHLNGNILIYEGGEWHTEQSRAATGASAGEKKKLEGEIRMLKYENELLGDMVAVTRLDLEASEQEKEQMSQEYFGEQTQPKRTNKKHPNERPIGRR
eukprot:Clim_evm82s152 gene=Clim_evmTU82s152